MNCSHAARRSSPLGLGAHGEAVAQAGAVGHHVGNGALLVDAGKQVGPGTGGIDQHIVAAVGLRVQGHASWEGLLMMARYQRGGIHAFLGLGIVEALGARTVRIAENHVWNAVVAIGRRLAKDICVAILRARELVSRFKG